MSDPSQELQKILLEKLAQAPGKKLAAGKLILPGNLLKSLKVGSNAGQETLDFLVERQYAARKRAGSGFTYRLTPEGEAYLQALEPALVAPNETLFG